MDTTESDVALISAVVKSVREIMAKNDASHDFVHIQRVLALARYILAEESQLDSSHRYNETVVTLAA